MQYMIDSYRKIWEWFVRFVVQLSFAIPLLEKLQQKSGKPRHGRSPEVLSYVWGWKDIFYSCRVTVLVTAGILIIRWCKSMA